MGIELTIACVPWAQMNDLRVQTLHDQVDELTDEDLEFDTDALDVDDYNRDELLRVLHDQVDLLRTAEDYWRHVNHIGLPELPYEVLVAGGYSYGEPTSDIYHAFQIIEDCDPLLSLMLEWAKQDFRKKNNGLRQKSRKSLHTLGTTQLGLVLLCSRSL